MASDQSTSGDSATTTREPIEDAYPAGTRIHRAVEVIGGAARVPPPPAPTVVPAGIPVSAPRPVGSDPSFDLFGSSAVAPEPAESAEAPEPAESAEEHAVVDRAPPATPAAATGDEQVVIDLRPKAKPAAGPGVVTVDVTDSKTWADAPQGWVRNSHGELDWHVVVTAADRLDRWEIDVPLGLVSVDVMLFGAISGDRIAGGRREAIDEIVAETLRRGGHAIVSTTQQVTQLEGSVLLSVTGTAATLADRTH